MGMSLTLALSSALHEHLHVSHTVSACPAIALPCPPVSRGPVSEGHAVGCKGSSQLLRAYIFCLILTKSHKVGFITLISHMNNWGLGAFKKLAHGLRIK